MAEPNTRIYEATVLGLPPLKMVLVHARNEAQNAANRPALQLVAAPEAEETAPGDQEQAIRRIIEALEEAD